MSRPTQDSFAEEPELVSVWRSPPPSSIWSTSPGAVAWVDREGGGYSIKFVPDSGSTSVSAQMFSDAIQACMELHLPGSKVEVDSELYLDMR